MLKGMRYKTVGATWLKSLIFSSRKVDKVGGDFESGYRVKKLIIYIYIQLYIHRHK